MDRDHSTRCETCGDSYGGLGGTDECQTCRPSANARAQDEWATKQQSKDQVISALRQQLAETEAERDGWRKAFEIGEDNARRNAGSLAKIDEILDAAEQIKAQRDLAIKERDELKQECARLRRLTLADEERLKLEGDAMHAEAELSKWQPVIEAARAWHATMDWQCSRSYGEIFTCEMDLLNAISSALTPAAEGQKEK